jgi:hypothetical protein
LAGASTTSGTVTSAPIGISCGSSCSSLYNSGQTVALTSTAPTGKLTSWTGCDAGSGGTGLSATVTTCSVTMGSTDKGVTVNYTAPAAPTLTVTKTANYGSVVGASLTCGNAATTCSATEVLNGAYTITATPAAGHSLDTAVPANNWGPGCISYPAYNKCALTMDVSKTIQVNFR